MGNKNNKSLITDPTNMIMSEQCRKEYFKVVKKEFTEGFKRINSTIHSDSILEDNWVSYLIDKFNEYSSEKKIFNKYIENILAFLNNVEESKETKHIYNLTIFLAKEVDETQIKYGINNCYNTISINGK